MKKYFVILISAGILTFSSCFKQNEKSKENKAQNTPVNSNTVDSESKLQPKQLNKKEAESFVTKFYNWYLSDIYPTKASFYESPPYIKKEDYYILSKDILLKRLKSVEYFSDKYINLKIEKLKKCNKSLFEKKITIEPEGGMSTKDCYYLDKYDFVVGNGERFDSFEINNSEHVSEGILVSVYLKIGEDKVALSKVLVNKFKDNNPFQIVNVDVDWL
ncbi:hypothetical protein ACSTS3_15080 [Aquimarina muelleri]|uniref:hypothetical protein n=1 Tax=Aquimarina TaxID=290174 RepID=UPI000CDE7250|nr:hypothetical protein [Aquimarina sp. I32.4]